MKSRASGFTLIELLIGMLLSMFVLLGLMSLYSSSVKNTVNANIGVKLDGDIQLALIQIDKLVQNAGFGLDTTGSYGSIIRVFDSGVPVTVIGTPGNAVAWKVGASSCRALESNSSGLVLHGAGTPYACTSGVALPSGTPSAETLVSTPAVVIEDSPDLGKFSFEIDYPDPDNPAERCFPFGVSATVVGATPSSSGKGAYVLIARANTYAGGMNNTVEGRTCLYNLR